MPDADNFFKFMAILFLALFVAENLMSLISALVPFYIIGMALYVGELGVFVIVLF